ncbi:hypothetical protein [Mailhella massiliensis]|uniref:Uncharacterized protein n=1 Tax=Mailhella massiliensis TaxID=1903261 RepID=A0A921AWV7_9BACT|nr:hypothetical protein [Mailhella massiliensis]HJD97258.1 hypothetical protein [Mailhella massiliensis]
MEAWAALVAALLEAGLRLLERLDEKRAADFRRRVASDGAGVLISQLNPGGASAPAGADEPSACDVGRDARRVDERR